MLQDNNNNDNDNDNNDDNNVNNDNDNKQKNNHPKCRSIANAPIDGYILFLNHFVLTRKALLIRLCTAVSERDKYRKSTINVVASPGNLVILVPIGD